jgi:hypothetical protein
MKRFPTVSTAVPRSVDHGDNEESLIWKQFASKI